MWREEGGDDPKGAAERLKQAGAESSVSSRGQLSFSSESSPVIYSPHSGIGSDENTPGSLFFLISFSSLCYIPSYNPASFFESQEDSPNGFTMQSMQRKFGRMTTKRSADDSQVAVLLKDFEDADGLLTKVGSLFWETRVPC